MDGFIRDKIFQYNKLKTRHEKDKCLLEMGAYLGVVTKDTELTDYHRDAIASVVCNYALRQLGIR